MENRKYTILFLVGLLIWFLGTWYFGFQREAVNGIERTTDTIGLILMMWGIFGDLCSNLTIIKKTEINTKKTTIEQHGEIKNIKDKT